MKETSFFLAVVLQSQALSHEASTGRIESERNLLHGGTSRYIPVKTVSSFADITQV